MEQLKLFIELTRLKKPIGYMLLFWPCTWGITITYNFGEEKITFLFYIALFLIGAILMRSAGCIVNDIVDKKFDKQVFRTKNRPIASGKVSVNRAIFISMFLCVIAFLVLIQFNNFTIFLALGSMPLAFVYPYMKRLTYWPQLFLGITFNYGLLIGWSSVNNNLGIIPIIFYIGAIFWTLGYDTIYGFQDIKDDEIIGLKSTSIKFKKNPKVFLMSSYLIFLTCITIGGWMLELGLIFFILLIAPLFHLIFYQINNFDPSNPEVCFKIFKSNNFLGSLIFLVLLLGNLSK
jgi:4-hydroxybenzoate polyprenyl transferase